MIRRYDRPTQNPVGQAHNRIWRLNKAIGDGPHAASFNRRHHIKTILVTLKDKIALALLDEDGMVVL